MVHPSSVTPAAGTCPERHVRALIAEKPSLLSAQNPLSFLQALAFNPNLHQPDK